MKRFETPMRKFLALTLSVVLCFSMLSTIAMATEQNGSTDEPNINLVLPSDVTIVPVVDGADPDESAPADEQLDESDDITDADEDADEDDANETATPTEGTSTDDDSDDETNGDDAEVVDNTNNIDEDEDSESETTTTEPTEEDSTDKNDLDETTAENNSLGQSEANGTVANDSKMLTGEVADLTVEDKPEELSDETPEIVYGDKGVTADGVEWEFTKDATTGKYTLTFGLEKTSEDGQPIISDAILAALESYTAEVSQYLAEKYGINWEWDSTAAPSGDESVQKFQVFLTSENDHTYRYDSVTLEQMDGEFTLEKIDGVTGLPITDWEATFQLWHINEVTNPETGETMDVKMYCSYDEETNTYTFIPTESTIQTINGKLEILYAMMKDTVYYLKEVIAPNGYEVDPSVHIIMEKELWESEDESFREQFKYLGEFTEDENGRIALDVKFVDYPKAEPVDDYDIVPLSAPVTDPEPDVDNVDEVPEIVPETEPDVPDVEITPTDVPEPEDYPEIPVTPVIPEPVENVNDVPKTGDMMNLYIMLSLVSAVGLICLLIPNRKNGKHEA